MVSIKIAFSFTEALVRTNVHISEYDVGRVRVCMFRYRSIEIVRACVPNSPSSTTCIYSHPLIDGGVVEENGSHRTGNDTSCTIDTSVSAVFVLVFPFSFFFCAD